MKLFKRLLEKKDLAHQIGSFTRTSPSVTIFILFIYKLHFIFAIFIYTTNGMNIMELFKQKLIKHLNY